MRAPFFCLLAVVAIKLTAYSIAAILPTPIPQTADHDERLSGDTTLTRMCSAAVGPQTGATPPEQATPPTETDTEGSLRAVVQTELSADVADPHIQTFRAAPNSTLNVDELPILGDFRYLQRDAQVTSEYGAPPEGSIAGGCPCYPCTRPDLGWIGPNTPCLSGWNILQAPNPSLALCSRWNIDVTVINFGCNSFPENGTVQHLGLLTQGGYYLVYDFVDPSWGTYCSYDRRQVSNLLCPPVPPGEYQIILLADVNHALVQCQPQCAGDTVIFNGTISVEYRPDLQISLASMQSPATLRRGLDDIVVRPRIENDGAGSASAYGVQIWLSNSAEPPLSGYRIGIYEVFPPLGGNGSWYEATFSRTVPFGIPTGTYGVWVKCDSEDWITECSDTNNYWRFASSVSIIDPCVPASISSHPSSATVCSGGSATFSVAAAGTPPLSYQWRHNGVDIVGANSASYTLNTVSPSDAGSYAAFVSNACGGLTSNSAVLTVNAAPGVPAGVMASDGASCGFVSVSWAPVAGATGYQVWRNTVNNSATAGQIGTPAASSFNDSAANAGTTYYYWVKATNPCGASPFSASDSGFRGAVPGAPTGVAATDGTSCTLVTVSWNTVAGATSYQVWRNTVNNSGTATQIGTTASSPYDDATAVAGTTYYYWVRAANVCGSSSFSISDSGVRAAVPAPSAWVAATDGTSCSAVTVTWNTVAGATAYQVWRNTTNDSATATQVGAPMASPYADSMAIAETTYYYWVKAVNTCGTSAFSGSDSGFRGRAVAITLAPQSVSACAGATASFSVVASGTAPIAYQWLRNGGGYIPDATGATYSINPVAVSDAGQYFVIVSNLCSSVTAPNVELTVRVRGDGNCDCTSAPGVAGLIAAWGYNAFGQCNVPAPNSTFVAAACGGHHTLGLRADGSISAWGYNGENQCNISAPNAGFMAIAAGFFHSLGLRADGSIAAWGYNGNGQCNVVLPNAGFVAVAAGKWHSLAIRADGSIAAWGYNSCGQCNVPVPNSGFVAAAGGISHSLGLRTDGSIAAWGCNNYGQCSVPAPNTGFVAVAAGEYHSLGLRADGSIAAWGQNGDGQCNVPVPNSGFSAVAAGYYHSLGIHADNSIVAWGRHQDGQCNIPEPNSQTAVVAGGYAHSLVVRSLYQDPTITANPTDRTVCPGDNVSFLVAADGTPPLQYQWRRNGMDLLNDEHLSGSMTRELMINLVHTADSGQYDCHVSSTCGSTISAAATLLIRSDCLIGDLNCDGSIDNFDIDPFVLALTNPAAYAASFPNCDRNNADVDHNGLINNFDIDPFVSCLIHHGCP